MKVNAINAHYIQRVNYTNNKNKGMQPAFGKIKWQSKEEVKQAQQKYENYQKNNEINDFFYRMHNFETAALSSAKYAKDLAKLAYKKGEECKFSGMGEVNINNMPHRVCYSNNNKNNYIIIEKRDDIWEFTFDKNESFPKEIHSVHEDAGFRYILSVTPKKTKYEQIDKSKEKIVKRFAQYDDGKIYEELSTAFMLNSCKRGIVKGFKKLFQEVENAQKEDNSTIVSYKKGIIPNRWHKIKKQEM